MLERGVAVKSSLRIVSCNITLSGRNKLSNVRSFSILQSGEGATFFNNDSSANFSVKKSTMKNSVVSIF